MRNVLSAIIVTTSAFLTTRAFAADNMGMKMSAPAPMAMSTAYTFELASPVKSEAGKSIVSVRIIHDKKPVTGAVIIQSRADMGPIGMAAMNAPIKALPVTIPGVYPFEITNGPVWKKADKWALTFAAKVQGQAETVHGSVVVELKP
jgi:Cu(I)/Ag(I) efflux system membrane fusion protein